MHRKIVKTINWIKDNLFLLSFALLAITTYNLTLNPKFLSDILRMDFKPYFIGASIVKDNKIDMLYNAGTQKHYRDELVKPYQSAPLTQKGLLSYRNPPFLAVLLSPLAKLSYVQAYQVMLVLNLIFSFVSIRLLWNFFELKKPISVWLPLFPPITVAILLGQITPLLLFIFTLALYSLKKPYVAGLITGLLLIKPQMVVLALVLIPLVNNKKNLLLGLFTSTAVFLLINQLLYGKFFIVDYGRFLITSENLHLGTDIKQNFNIQAIYSLLAKDHAPNIFVALGGIVLYIVTLVKLSRVKMGDFNKLTVGIILGLSLNIHTMPADLVFMLIPTIFLYKYLTRGSIVKHMYLIFSLTLVLGAFGFQWLATIITLLVAVALIPKRGRFLFQLK